MAGWRCGAVALLLGWGFAASAQDVRPQSLQMYGGTYSTDCRNAAAPRLRISAEALVIEQGARRQLGRGVMDSYTSFGGAPTSPVPPGYVMEFISDAFSFYVFQDQAGLYIEPAAGAPSAAAVIGKANMQARFRRCAADAR
ncbi:hypothetical protein ACFQZQ_06235 [Lysobacter koreensis]|uniref:Uncharacterized protein n=1 Tax=Lysobacter koreensis TaxID=266122 RepID=A0ABW2YQ00_9GAMM